MTHKLHEYIGKIIVKMNFPDCEIIRDKACGGNQNIPLFSKNYKTNMTKYCNADILIIKDNKIKIIIEIDESNIIPTKICGKFLTSAISNYYIHESHSNNPIYMSDSVLFIQIIGTDNLKTDLTSKIEQFRNIKESIQKIIPLKESKIKKYKLFPVITYNKTIEKFLFSSIMNHLNS